MYINLIWKSNSGCWVNMLTVDSWINIFINVKPCPRIGHLLQTKCMWIYTAYSISCTRCKIVFKSVCQQTGGLKEFWWCSNCLCIKRRQYHLLISRIFRHIPFKLLSILWLYLSPVRRIHTILFLLILFQSLHGYYSSNFLLLLLQFSLNRVNFLILLFDLLLRLLLRVLLLPAFLLIWSSSNFTLLSFCDRYLSDKAHSILWLFSVLIYSKTLTLSSLVWVFKIILISNKLNILQWRVY